MWRNMQGRLTASIPKLSRKKSSTITQSGTLPL